MTNREFFIQRWEAEFPVFLRIFRALPAATLAYRPHERSRSAAELVWLMVYEEQVGSELIDSGEIHWQETPPTKSLDEMVADYERHHGALAERLRKVDDVAFERKGKFFVGGQLVMEEKLCDFFWLTLFDAVHHRGQLSTYIRPMGGKVPSIYGPSADDMGG